MKIVSKILSVIFVLLILSVSILSVCGYSYYVGDNEITFIKGSDDLALSYDMGNSLQIDLVPSTTDEVEKAFDIIEERIASIGLTDYRMYIQDSTKNIQIVIPEEVVHDFNASDLVVFLTQPGFITLRPGKEFGNNDGLPDLWIDSSGGAAMATPAGETAQSVILSSDDIISATYYDYTEEDTTRYFLDIEFNESGSALLSQFTDPNLASSSSSLYESVVSLWIDDQMIAYPTVTEHCASGYMSFSNDDFTEDKVKLFAAIIDSGVLPCHFTNETTYMYNSPVAGNNSANIAYITAIAALLIFAFVLIYLFRANGVITLICMTLQFAVLFCILTGFFADTNPFMINISVLAAAALAIMLTALSCIIISSKIKESINSGNVFLPAVKNGFKSSAATIFDITIVCAIISLLGMLMFGPTSFSLGLFGNALYGGLYRFCYILFIGSLVNFVSGYLFPRFLVGTLLDIRFFSKPSMFGGKEK